jgi:phage-related protein
MESYQRTRRKSAHLEHLGFLTNNTMEKRKASSINGGGLTGLSTHRIMQIDLYLSPWTKLKPKWIKDLNIKLNTPSLINEKVGNSLECIGTGDSFLNRSSTTHALRLTINKWDLTKLKSFFKAKDTIKGTKWQPTEWEKIFKHHITHRGLISKYIKNSGN